MSTDDGMDNRRQLSLLLCIMPESTSRRPRRLAHPGIYRHNLDIGIMGEFVAERAVKSFGGTRGGGASEAAALRHADDVSRRDIVGFIATLLDDRTGCLDEGFSLSDRVERRLGWDIGLIEREAVHLGGIEDPAGTRNHAFGLLGLTGLVIDLLDIESLVEDDEGGFLALAHLAPDILPLAVGAPDIRGILRSLCRDPEADNVHPVIGLARCDIDGASKASGFVGDPGELEFACVFESINDAAGDFLMDIEFG